MDGDSKREFEVEGVCPRMEAVSESAFARNAVHLVNRAAQLARVASGDALKPLGISARQLAVLETLRAHEPLMQQEIGALLAIDRTSVVALIDGLERQGLVVRKPHPCDRRAYALTLTERGAETTGLGLAALEGVESRMLAPLTDEEAASLKDYLRRLIADRKESPESDDSDQESTCPGLRLDP